MKRSAMAGVVWAMMLIGLVSNRAQAINPVYTVEWVGPPSGGLWTDASWRNVNTNTTGNAATIFGQTNGSDGMNTTSMATTRARNIVIDNATVTYPRAVINSDFRIVQGTTMTVKNNGVWQQVTDGTYTENGWTQMDMSQLTLDDGIFRRTGESPAGDGGGIVLFSSYRDDNNLARLGSPRINVLMTNGGRIENTGQLWFGADDEHTPDGRTIFTIKDGAMDLTGGTIPQTNSTLAVTADMAFFYDYSEALGRPKNEEYAINFTGPGSITVDSAGINVYRQDSDSIWTGGAAVTYESLWNDGILKANGLSGQTGSVPNGGGTTTARTPATFSDYFTTTGTAGTDNYVLTAKPATTIDTVEWNGPASGVWTDASWRNTRTNVTADAATQFGQTNGSDGMNTTNPATTRARHIVIDGGASVTYPRAVLNSDLRIVQGTTLTIKEGAVLQQVTDGTYTENGWTQMDMTQMTLDNGTFRRTGESPAGDGGGIVLYGSYRDDNNIARLGSPRINVDIKNGGKIENTGQMWFGADDEHSPDMEISFTINEGSLDLTGGTIPQTNSTLAVTADLAMFFDYSEGLARPKNEQYSINFTGPGSITVDSAGINVYTQDSDSIWTGGAPVSYQDLWNMGILKANGLSGETGSVANGGGGATALTPATFSDFFSVVGTPGADNYILNSLIEATPDLEEDDADYNDDGTIDAADYVAGRKLGFDLNLWQQQFGQSSPGGGGSGGGSGGVPEPGALLLMALGLASVSLSSRRSR